MSCIAIKRSSIKRFKLFILSLLGLFLHLCFALPALLGQERPYNQSFENLTWKDTVLLLREIEAARDFLLTNPDSALIATQIPLSHSRRLHFHYGTARALMQRGTAYTNKGQYPQAIGAYEESKLYFERSGWGRKDIPLVLSNLGNVYFLEGKYDQALHLYYEGLRLAEKDFPEVNVDFIYSNLAGVLTQIGRDPESARYYLDKAEQAAYKNKNYLTLCKVYSNKGFAYMTHKLWDSSLLYFEKAYDLSSRNHLLEMQYLSLTNIGIVYLEQSKGDSALYYLQQAVPLEGQVPESVRNRSRGALGVAYLLVNAYDKAAPLLLQQHTLAQNSGNKTELRESYYNLAKLYHARKDYQQAFQNAWSYINLNDSIAGKEIISNVNQQEVSFRTAEKEKIIMQNQLTIALQQQAIANKNRWMTLFICCGAILMLLLFTIWKAYRSRQKLNAEKLRNMEQDREIENLHATINGEEKERLRIARELHDGIGAMVSAAKMNLVVLGKENYSIATRDIYQSTTHILEEVSSELRLTAHNLMPKALMEKSLTEAVLSFCQYTQQHKQINIEVQTYGNFDGLPDDFQLSIYRMIQELVHNVVKHAQASKALVQLIFQNPIISITVEDNGKGMSAASIEHNGGVGLESFKNRVKSRNGTYSINSAPGKGTSFYIEFEVDD